MKRPNITPPPYTIQLSDHHADDSKIVADGEVVAICCSRGHLGEQHATTKAFAAVPDLLKALERCLPDWHAEDDPKEHEGKIAGEISIGDMRAIKAALTKAGFTDTQPPPPCEACHGSGQKEIQSGPYFHRCEGFPI